MAEKDLIPLGKKGDAYSDSIRAKAKGSASDKRKFAQKINSIPKMSDENAEKEILQLVSNPQISAIQIQKLLQQCLKRNLSDANFINLINTLIRKHSALFGNKIEMSGDLKIQTTADAVLQRLRDYKKLIAEKGEEEAEKLMLSKAVEASQKVNTMVAIE